MYIFLDRVLEQRKMLSMYEAVHDIWIAETGNCNSSYEDFRWAWFVGMCVPTFDIDCGLQYCSCFMYVHTMTLSYIFVNSFSVILYSVKYVNSGNCKYCIV